MGFVKRQYDTFVWEYKYRPSKISEIVLPERFKNQFGNIVASKNIPNMLLSGPRGTGKTTTAFCLADEIGCDCKYVNMSKDNSVDLVRNELSRFASSVSFDDGKKLIIGDEFDRLSIQAIDALKGDMDRYGKYCTFIFTSNHKYKFIDHPVMSRIQEIDFEFSKEEKIQMQKDFYKIVCNILKKEEVKFEKKAIGHVIKTVFPDMRKILIELQKLSSQFNNDLSVINLNKSFLSMTDIKIFFDALKDKDFDYVRQFISELSIDISQFYSIIFDNLTKYMDDIDSIYLAMKIIDEQQYRTAFSIDKQIPLVACCIRLMSECEWK